MLLQAEHAQVRTSRISQSLNFFFSQAVVKGRQPFCAVIDPPIYATVTGPPARHLSKKLTRLVIGLAPSAACSWARSPTALIINTAVSKSLIRRSSSRGDAPGAHSANSLFSEGIDNTCEKWGVNTAGPISVGRRITKSAKCGALKAT